MHEHKSSVPNRGHGNFVFKSIAFHRTGEFGFDEKCTTIYHVSCVFTLAEVGETARLKRCAALGSTQLGNLPEDLKPKKN